MSKPSKTNKPDSGWNDLSAIHDAMEASSKRKQAEWQAFLDKLGEPDKIIATEDGIETGYWRVDGGVFSYRRNWRNPQLNQFKWMEHSRVEYTDEMLNTLAAVHVLPPRKAPEGESE